MTLAAADSVKARGGELLGGSHEQKSADGSRSRGGLPGVDESLHQSAYNQQSGSQACPGIARQKVLRRDNGRKRKRGWLDQGCESHPLGGLAAEPLQQRRFWDCSFSFRPMVCCHQALPR